MRHWRTAFFALLLLSLLIGGVGLWLRGQQQQYTLNRQLIAALVNQDNKQALALVNEGADPNTRYKPTPVPSLLELVEQLFHRSPPPISNSPTALMIACGATWDDADATADSPKRRPLIPQLVQVMLLYGAAVNVQDDGGHTALSYAVGIDTDTDLVRYLLAHGADPNLADNFRQTPLFYAQGHPDNAALLRQAGARK